MKMLMQIELAIKKKTRKLLKKKKYFKVYLFIHTYLVYCSELEGWYHSLSDK